MEDDLTYKLVSQHLELDGLLFGLDDKFLHHKIDGKWSISEIIAHLGRYQEIFSKRLELMLNMNCHFLNRYIAENDMDFAKWCNKDLKTIVRDLKTDREKIIHMLSILSSSELERLGEHPTLGKMAIKDWITFFLYHESHHLYQIFRLKNQMKNYIE